MSSLQFSLPEGHDWSWFIKQATSELKIKPDQNHTQHLAFYDTFDWRLFNQSLVLYQHKDRLCVRNLFTNTVLHTIVWTELPRFVRDLPDSNLKAHLAPIVNLRALLALAEVKTVTTPYRVLNDIDKTVAWLDIVETHLCNAQGLPVFGQNVVVRLVRGYQKSAQMVADFLLRSGLSVVTNADIYFEALQTAGKTPGDYTAKPTIILRPEMRTDLAIKLILQCHLEVMRRNESYIKQDIDTEFLHDFRVAIRKTRSALSQVKLIFPAETADYFRQEFSDIGKSTNILRDLDVYLLNEAGYRARVPQILRDDIGPLFSYLQGKRSEALGQVRCMLDSTQYAQTVQAWELFLAAAPTDSPVVSNAARPVIEVASERIYKTYSQIVKLGRKILKNTEDEQLHSLRIECKKLRYLLEFFESLFPADQMNGLVKQLKQLQDNLGLFNDLCVQEDYLLTIVAEMPVIQPPSPQTVLAIGSLIGALNIEREQVKGAFVQTFSTFVAPANRQQFKQLFHFDSQ